MLLTICSTTTNIILCCHNTCVFLNSYLADHILTLERTFQSMAATATHQKSARLWCYSYQPIMSARGTRPHARGVAKNSLYLFVTESQRRVPLRLPYQCWAQSVDLRDPWIALCNLWIHTLRRNPWIAQESMDRAVRFMNFAYSDTIYIVGAHIVSFIWTDL